MLNSWVTDAGRRSGESISPSEFGARHLFDACLTVPGTCLTVPGTCLTGTCLTGGSLVPGISQGFVCNDSRFRT